MVNNSAGNPYSGYPYGSIQFTLKTTTKDGYAMECNNPNNGCPITPAKSAPVQDGQFMYENKAGWCTVDSNSASPFPPYKGVLIIVLSWFFSPVLTAIASAILFTLCRQFVLRSEKAYKRSFIVLPFLAFLTFWTDIYFVLTKGAAKLLARDAEGWTLNKAAWISAAAAGGVSFFCVIVVIPVMYRSINTTFAREEEEAKEAAKEVEAKQVRIDAGLETEKDPEKADGELKTEEQAPQNKLMGFLQAAKKAALHGVTADIHEIVETDEVVAAIHANAEVFDPKAEAVFSYMQVFSAICVIFAHGAGEVGYMSGPLGAIFQIVRSGTLPNKTSPPIWTVIVGALGLVIGLGTYGYQVTRAVGTRMAKLTPSRGFAAELSTSMIIMIAAQYGLPTSSSQCITGGIIGIALCEGRAGLNVKFLFQTFMSWIWTVVLVALVVGGFFAQGAFAPSVQGSSMVSYYEEAISTRTNQMLTSYQTMIYNSGYKKDANDAFSKYLDQTVTNTANGQYYQYARAPDGFYPGKTAPVIQTVNPFQMVGLLDTALGLIQASVIPNPKGINMCSGQTYNFSTTTNTAPNFPWSYKPVATSAYITDYSTQLLGPNGPCTGTPSSPLPSSITLTQAVFVGPSPNNNAFRQEYLDKKGNLVGFNATVDVRNPKTGTVTLDQTINWKTCQQAPCNQRFNVDPVAYNG